MKQITSLELAREQRIVGPLEDGYLDDVFSIFRARQHPIVLVEESALRWMGLRVCPEEDLDLLIRDSDMELIKADFLATGQFQLEKQDLHLRLSDTYTLQVPRLRRKTKDTISYTCFSLWSESVYMLSVDGEKIEVPDTHAWNPVLMEERFDLHSSWAAPIGHTAKIKRDVRILPPTLTRSADMKIPIYIPTIPRMFDAQLDQMQYRVTHPESFGKHWGNRPRQSLLHAIRYLHLERTQQRERLLPELAERNRGEMEAIINQYKRKPLHSLATFQNRKLD